MKEGDSQKLEVLSSIIWTSLAGNRFLNTMKLNLNQLWRSGVSSSSRHLTGITHRHSQTFWIRQNSKSDRYNSPHIKGRDLILQFNSGSSNKKLNQTTIQKTFLQNIIVSWFSIKCLQCFLKISLNANSSKEATENLIIVHSNNANTWKAFPILHFWSSLALQCSALLTLMHRTAHTIA